MTDPLANPGLVSAAMASGPGRSAEEVTPSDTTDLDTFSRALYVGGAGDVTVDLAETGSSITFAAVPAGTLLPISARRVRATGTTATSVVALW